LTIIPPDCVNILSTMLSQGGHGQATAQEAAISCRIDVYDPLLSR
jgi:hypothetical protein